MRNQGPCDAQHEKSPFNIVKLLKACTATKDLHKGSELHEYVQKHNRLRESTYVGNTLISMYAKCGALAKAHQVLKELPICDVVSWTALIAGHAQQGQGAEALNCFDEMLCEGNSPNAVTLICVLKACGSIGAAAKGEEIHEKIVSLNMLEKNIVLGTTLVDMYAKCGAFTKAHKVLKELPKSDVFSWSALIAGYSQHGKGEEALKCFDDMLREGHFPDATTFASVLNACGSIRAAAKGKEIHEKIVNMGMLEKNTVLGNTLVDMYAKCGVLDKAYQVIEELPTRDVVSWNAIIAGCTFQGQGEEALKCFGHLLWEGHSPNAITFACVLKSCGSTGAAAKGEEIHQKILSMGMLEKDLVLGNTLVDMYAKCGALAKAHQLLRELPMSDVVSWTALIAGYAEQGQGEETLKCFDDMLHEGHIPNAITYICVFKACGSLGAVAKGEEIHEMVVSTGMLEKNIALGNALVGMYARSGVLAKAHQVFKELPFRNIFSWSTIITGYTLHGQGEEALKSFDDMLCEGHTPNAVTFVCVLKACGSIGATARGENIHEKIVNIGMLDQNIVLGNALVDMYAKCGALAKAHQVLKELPIRDAISWNALIAGCAQQGQGEEALNCFDDMLCEGHAPNALTFACVLKACRSIGALARGEEIHEKIVSMGMLEKNFVLGNILVDMYAKCGALAKAHRVLTELPICDVLSWNALMAGYAQQGSSVEVINCFERMQLNGVKPDMISLTMVLNACSHSGLLDQAEACFSGMSTRYGIYPSVEHYCCMVDLFIRAGKFNNAFSIIVGMPNDERLSSWVIL